MSSAAPIIAVYLSSHGYGHCTRTTALLERLVQNTPVRLDVNASCPRWLWGPVLEAYTRSWRDEPCDVGVVQPDTLTVDHAATAAALAQWDRDYARRVGREAERLRSGVDLVLGDVPALAFDAAERAGVPAVALANFSWDWIYERLGFDAAASAAAEAYARARLLLELDPACPMPAFRHRLPIGVLGRRPSGDPESVRRAIGVRPDQRLVLIAVRGAADGLIALPEARDDIRYVYPGGTLVRDDLKTPGPDHAFIALLAAADAVVAKPGYGIIGDAAACGTRMLYVMRRGFPEDEVLAAWLDSNSVSTRVAAETLAAGAWLAPLETLMARERRRPVGDTGVSAACDAIREMLG